MPINAETALTTSPTFSAWSSGENLTEQKRWVVDKILERTLTKRPSLP